MVLCLTVVGELLYGVAESGRPTENHDRVERLLTRCPLVAQDVETASHYGRLKANLRELGRPIPENDLWIAASALRHGLTLATRDRHFDLIEDLRTERW
ncbi:MAG: PIN domain-containing protein [Holophagales bacterium]|nr:PIN domain-containing protein [Holophagales bacterium]